MIQIKEPKNGEYKSVEVCYTANITSPLDRDAVFDLILSPTSTANISTDFYLNTSNPLIIESGQQSGGGVVSGCIHLVVIGDEEDEADTETIAYEIRARSDKFDRVVFRSDAPSNLIMVHIFDIGKIKIYAAEVIIIRLSYYISKSVCAHNNLQV